MRASRWQALTTLGLGTLAVAWAAFGAWTAAGRVLPPLTWVTTVALVLLAWIVWLLGRPVRRWNAGQRDRPLNPLLAARVVVVAKAASHGGAVLAGWYAAQAVAVGLDILAALRPREVTALATCAAALVLVVSGLATERGCRIPPEDDEPPTAARA